MITIFAPTLLLYFLAFIFVLSIFRKKKQYSNGISTLLDFLCPGSGEIANRKYIGVMTFFISSLIIFFFNFAIDQYLAVSRTINEFVVLVFAFIVQLLFLLFFTYYLWSERDDVEDFQRRINSPIFVPNTGFSSDGTRDLDWLEEVHRVNLQNQEDFAALNNDSDQQQTPFN